MKTISISKILLPLIMLSSFLGNSQITKPNDFAFGKTIEEIQHNLKTKCTKLTLQNITPIQLPTAKTSQKQLDCSEYEFAGQKRDVELVFADGILDLVWVLTTAEEEKDFIKQYTKLYGKPTHQLKEATFFLNDGIGVRNNPHEVLFLSNRLKTPYKQWLESQNKS